MKSSFSLIPFTPDTAPAVQITGNIERRHNLLNIEYTLAGQSLIVIPEITKKPTRQVDLWLHTCCEFFLGLQDSTQYWEFNLSPAGHWNIYRFLHYRQDLVEETAFDSLPFQVLPENDILQLKLQVNLNKIITPEQSLEIGITTVIEDRESQLSYWALTHPAREADFHQRNSYLLKL
jgi:hypothetical protein